MAIQGFIEVSITVTVVGGAFSVYDDVEGIRLDSRLSGGACHNFCWHHRHFVLFVAGSASKPCLSGWGWQVNLPCSVGGFCKALELIESTAESGAPSVQGLGWEVVKV